MKLGELKSMPSTQAAGGAGRVGIGVKISSRSTGLMWVPLLLEARVGHCNTKANDSFVRMPVRGQFSAINPCIQRMGTRARFHSNPGY
jgi:hypothetical protein